MLKNTGELLYATSYQILRYFTVQSNILVAIGAVIYYIVIQIVLWLGLNTNLLKLLSALIVAVFLAIPFWKEKLAIANAGKGGKGNA